METLGTGTAGTSESAQGDHLNSDMRAASEKSPASYLLGKQSGNESVVVQALQECQAAIDAGVPIDRVAMLEKYSGIREELAACLEGLELMRAASVGDQTAQSKATSVDQILRQVSPATTLGDFRLIREIGKGGMGVVYEAEQLSVGRTVAVKVLPYASMLDKRRVIRFQNEARAAATLEHPHIVPVYFVGNDRGVHYYAMRLIEGQNLAELMQDLKALIDGDGERTGQSRIASELTQTSAPDLNGGLVRSGAAADTQPEMVQGKATTIATDPEKGGKVYYNSIARLGCQIASALDCAHNQGIVHRDIKPANIMLDTTGDAWITDFGLARIDVDAGMTMTGNLIGTVRYMSPEQTLAKRVTVDHRTDIYSLAATLYELVTRRPLYEGSDRESLLRQIAFEEPRLPSKIVADIPRDLETIILRGLSKNPDDRYATASELEDDLNRFLSHEPIVARRTPLHRRMALWARRHPATVTVASVVSVVMLVSAAVISALVANHERNLRIHEAQAGAVISVTLDEKEIALDAAQENLEGALNAIDQFLVNLSSDDFPRYSQIRSDLVRDAFEIYQKLESSNELPPRLKTRKLYAIVKANRILDVKQSELGRDLRDQGRRLAKELLADEPHALPVLFSNIYLHCVNEDYKRQTGAEHWERVKKILQSLHQQVEHFGSIDAMFQSLDSEFEIVSTAFVEFHDYRGIGKYLDSYDHDELRFYRDLMTSFANRTQSADVPTDCFVAGIAAQVSFRVGDIKTGMELLAIARDPAGDVALPSSLIDRVLREQGRAQAIKYCEEQLARHESKLIKSPERPRTFEYATLQVKLASLLSVGPNLVSRVEHTEQELAMKHPLVRRNILLGELYRQLGDDELSIRHYEESRILNRNILAWAIAGHASRLYRERGEFDKALNCYPSDGSLHHRKSRSAIIYEQAIATGDEQAYQRAIEELRPYVDQAPGDGSSFFHGEMSALRVGAECKNEAFKRQFSNLAELALKANPSRRGRREFLMVIAALGFQDKAIQLAKTGEEREFLRVAHELIEKRATAKTDPEKRLIEARMNLSADYTSLGRINNLTWLLVASSQEDLRDPAEAAELCQPLIAYLNSNEDASLCNTVGVVHYRNGRFRDALEALERSKTLDDYEFMRAMNDFVIAMSHWKLEQREQATIAYQAGMAWIEGNPAQEAETIMFQKEAERLLHR